MSNLRLLLETDDETIDYVYSGSVHARDHDPGCFVASVTKSAARRTGDGSYCMPIHECNKK